MAQDQNPEPEASNRDQGDGQLRSLITLFNWLVGEVVTARIMVLRLAGDLVRIGVLPVEEINGMPLTPEIIDSVMSNFPTDPTWQALGQRLRNSLDALRSLDLRANNLEDEEDMIEELDAQLADACDDVMGVDEDVEEVEETQRLMEADLRAEVIYRHPDHEVGVKEAALLPRLPRPTGRRHN